MKTIINPTILSSSSRTGLHLLVAVLSFALGTTAAFAQDSAGPEPALPSKKLAGFSVLESYSLRKSVKDNDEIVRVSKIAEQRASLPEVKQFAQRVAAEYENANTELQTLASRKGVELPALSGDGLEKKWSRKDAKDFDTDYLRQMESDIESAVKIHEKRAASDDPEIAAYAKKILPVLQENLRAVRALSGNTGQK